MFKHPSEIVFTCNDFDVILKGTGSPKSSCLSHYINYLFNRCIELNTKTAVNSIYHNNLLFTFVVVYFGWRLSHRIILLLDTTARSGSQILFLWE